MWSTSDHRGQLQIIAARGAAAGDEPQSSLTTASLIPELEILHQKSPAPVTPLGAKGVAEGNAMSTPVCIADAVADALGAAEVSLCR
jgi:hypothetical protein